MPLPYAEINVFCQDYVMPVLVDNIFKSNIAFWRFFKSPSKWLGGTKIDSPVEYAKNSNAMAYAGSQQLTIDEVEIATMCALPPRQYNVGVTVTGIEEAENTSDGKRLDLVKKKMKNAGKSLKDLMGTHFFAVQTGVNLDGVGGIFAANDGTKYAEIDPADFALWKSNGGNRRADVSGNLTFAKFEAEWCKCKVDTDRPTLIITTDDIFSGIEEIMVEKQKRYEDKKLANIGFDNVTWHGKPITTDSHTPAQTLYLFNEEYLKAWVLGGMNFKFIPFQKPRDRDVKTAHIRWYGNLLCTNVARQGQMINITGVA